MLQEEIRAIIEKNLPNETGVILKERLKQADKDADEVKHLNTEIKSYQKEAQTLKALVEEYRAFDVRNAKLDQREAELNRIQHDLDLAAFKYELAVEKEKSEFTKSITLGLVRNTNYRKTIFDSENQTPYWDGHNTIHPSPVNKKFTETQTED